MLFPFLLVFSITHLVNHIFSYLNATKSVQVTSSEYDIHKGKIAIGRLHAGVLHRGMEVKVGLHQG